MEEVVLSQADLLFALNLAVGALLALALFLFVAASVFFWRAMKRKSENQIYQAPQDIFFSPGCGLVGPESGDQAYQAPAGEAEGPILRAAREYDEAMRIVDRQVERATRQVLLGRGGQVGQASPLKFEDVVSEFAGPHQAAAPGVKDE